jgi:transposase-like protein
VGCAEGTVYAALRRFGIPRRRGRSTASELREILTAQFLQAQYVDGGRSAPSIAEEVGCDSSTIYAALRRHGIATRGASSSTRSWRGTAELLDQSYLEAQYSDQGRTPAEIASTLGCPRRHVLDALTHHGLLVMGAAVRDYRSVLTKEFLTESYLEKALSGKAIAEQVGCHPATVYEALRRHGVTATGPRAKKARWESVLTRDYLLETYVEGGLSGGQIAEEAGCTPSIVYAWLERHGIERREARETRGRSAAVNWDPVWLREQYVEMGRSGSHIARELGVPGPTLYSALRRFGIRRD